MLIAVAVGALAGGFAGWAARRLLARMRRGVVIRPPVLELACAVLTGIGILAVWPSAAVAVVVWVGLLVVTLGAVDVVAHRLPDALTLPAIPITAGLLVLTWLLAPASGSVATAAAAAVVVTGVFWGLAALLPRSMGLGDVKLVPTLALTTGYASVAAVLWWLMLAFGLGAAVAVLGLAARRLSLGSAIPFGPCLLAGCWLVLAFPALSSL
jgi:leader peptidase (prepilin peptidase)/N-methyltransferase